MNSSISDFIKEKRKQIGITQVELTEIAEVGLRFVRELEQGKQTVRLVSLFLKKRSNFK